MARSIQKCTGAYVCTYSTKCLAGVWCQELLEDKTAIKRRSPPQRRDGTPCGEITTPYKSGDFISC